MAEHMHIREGHMLHAELRLVQGHQGANGWVLEMAPHTVPTIPIFGLHGWNWQKAAQA